MLLTLAKKDCTVHAHLENLADLSFLLFVLYRVNHTSFMPAQNHHNAQSMVKSMFVSVLTGQLEGTNEYFPFLDSDDRIEVSSHAAIAQRFYHEPTSSAPGTFIRLAHATIHLLLLRVTTFAFACLSVTFEVSFCILRSLFSGDNFDGVQFVERASAVGVIQRIFVRRPEIERASRHLVVPDRAPGVATCDHMNPRTYLRVDSEEGGMDRTRYSIKKDVCKPVKAWNSAPDRISTFLAAEGYASAVLDFTAIAVSDVGMMRPEGEWVGVTALELDDEVGEIELSEDVGGGVGGDDELELEVTWI